MYSEKPKKDPFRPTNAKEFREHDGNNPVSEQSVFNAVYSYIMFEQKAPGMSENDGCVYLADNGNRCGIGALMNDAELKVHGNAIENLEGLVKIDMKQDSHVLRPFFHSHVGLMAALQRAHDKGYVEIDKVATESSEEHRNRVFLVEADKRFRAVADLWSLEVPNHPDL